MSEFVRDEFTSDAIASVTLTPLNCEPMAFGEELRLLRRSHVHGPTGIRGEFGHRWPNERILNVCQKDDLLLRIKALIESPGRAAAVRQIPDPWHAANRRLSKMLREVTYLTYKVENLAHQRAATEIQSLETMLIDERTGTSRIDFSNFAFSEAAGTRVVDAYRRLTSHLIINDPKISSDVPKTAGSGAAWLKERFENILDTLGNSIPDDTEKGIEIILNGRFSPGIEVELFDRMPLLPTDLSKIIEKMIEELSTLFAETTELHGNFGALYCSESKIYLRPDGSIDEEIRSEFAKFSDE